MITFNRENETVTLVIPAHDYNMLLMVLGYAAISAEKAQRRRRSRQEALAAATTIDFVNEFCAAGMDPL